jgi:hypothetical protein
MSTSVAAVEVPAPEQKRSKGLRVALWVVQIFLALAFGMAGFMKLTRPIAELAAQMAWVNEVNEGLVRFIGASELLGAIGLVVPAAVRIKPALTPLAAAALVVVMILAAGFHVVHSEFQLMPPSLFLGALAAFVAWGRYQKAPIQPR